MPPFCSVKSHTHFISFCLQPCEAYRHVHRKDSRILGSVSTRDAATASLNLSSFLCTFTVCGNQGGEASPTLKRKYLPVKETLPHQPKPRQVGTLSADARGSFYFRRGRVACHPSSPNTLYPLPTLLADEETDVQSGHLLSVTQQPEGSFIFLESIYLRK